MCYYIKVHFILSKTLSYLLGCLALLALWAVFFIWRRDIRKEMLVISITFGFAGLLVDPVYSSDWWRPLTLTNTMPGIESFVFGFVVAGIASAAYLEIFREKIRIRKADKKIELKRNISYIEITLLAAILFFSSVFIFKLNSFWASFPSLLIPTGIIWMKRKDLIFESLASGLLLMLSSLIFYIVPEIITPGWVNSAWNFNMISGIVIFKAPLEDLIWFFLAGAFIGPLYEYWQEAKLVKLKKKNGAIQ